MGVQLAGQRQKGLWCCCCFFLGGGGGGGRQKVCSYGGAGKRE